jgi:hypothetical protein
MRRRWRPREARASKRHSGDGGSGDKGNEARRNGHDKLLNKSVVSLASGKPCRASHLQDVFASGVPENNATIFNDLIACALDAPTKDGAPRHDV